MNFLVKDSQFYLSIRDPPQDNVEPKLLELKINILHWNLIPFATLLVLLPPRLLVRRVLDVLAAVTILFTSHVFHLIFIILPGLAKTLGPQWLDLLSAPVRALLPPAVVLFETIVSPILPLVLLAPLFLSPAAARAQKGAESLKVGRNEPCLCGSGKKFKRCCWVAQR